jgi:polyhydroxybutyrate depolymerase
MNRRVFLTLCAGGGTSAIAGCSQNGPSDYKTIDIGGFTRRYLIDFPSDYRENSGRTYPLLVALHGGAGSARGFSERNGFVETADREEFIIVHPDGRGLTNEKVHVWNTEYFETRLSDADDYAFLTQLIRHLVETISIDKRRIYLVGHSMGAMLTHEMAARYPELFAAVAPVAGTVGGYPCQSPDRCDAYTPPAPSQPTSIVTVHGTADKHVLYDGGQPKKSLRRQPRYDFSVQQTIDWWKRHNSCTGDSAEKSVSESGQILRRTYSCDGSLRVEHLGFDGVGHFWGEFDDAVANEEIAGERLADLLWRRLSNNQNRNQ